ncbi:hypothetical protein HanPI659440_Chr03g0112751 [Helianthus annuus]|nr:hypothetical protein HanPI659440_Chr03g0112751 [Helianthus annuus]
MIGLFHQEHHHVLPVNLSEGIKVAAYVLRSPISPVLRSYVRRVKMKRELGVVWGDMRASTGPR